MPVITALIGVRKRSSNPHQDHTGNDTAVTASLCLLRRRHSDGEKRDDSNGKDRKLAHDVLPSELAQI